MANAIFPTPAVNTTPGSAYTVPLAQTIYELAGKTLSSGVYTITTFPTTSQVTVTFANSTQTFSTTTIDGIVVTSLAFEPSNTFVRTDTGTSVLVSLTRTANALSAGGLSGTLDTITTSGTYNQTGKLFVVAIAGGEGGGSGGANGVASWTGDEYGGGNGGTSGAWAVYGPGFVNTAQTITIGTGGNGQAALTGNATGITRGNAGGTTSFGSLAVANNANVNLNKGLGGNVAGQGAVQASSVLYRELGNITTGGGGHGAHAGAQGGSDNQPNGWFGSGAGSGVGSGIGTGGNGANTFSTAPNAATGRAAGGGGGYGRTSRWNGSAGAAGTGGVVYVLRGF